MEDKRELFKFLNSQMPTYHNPLGVQVYLNTDSTLFICSNFPGIETLHDISLEIFQEVKSVSKLFALLRISKVEQLLELNPSNLFELYACGRMSVVCTLEDPIDREIWFIKNKKGVWASIDNKEIHKVEIQHDKAEDYINYTIKFFNIERKGAIRPTI